MQLLKTDSVSRKPEKPAPVPGPPDAPPAPSSASVPATPPAKSASLLPSASQPPQSAPAEAGQGLKEKAPPLVEGAGAKEEYGYIVTNQRSALSQVLLFITNKLLKPVESIIFLRMKDLHFTLSVWNKCQQVAKGQITKCHIHFQLRVANKTFIKHGVEEDNDVFLS